MPLTSYFRLKMPFLSTRNSLRIRKHFIGIRFASSVIPLLNRPIGSRVVPRADDNQGLDQRTVRQKFDDLRDYDKNLQRREEIKKELASSYFQPIYDFTNTKGKLFRSPSMYFREDKALYMPNLCGYTLESRERKGTTSVLQGNISIVRMFTSIYGENQTRSYFNEDVYKTKEDGFQIVDISLPENAVKEFISWLNQRTLRRMIPQERHERYFTCRKGVTPEIRGLINAQNIYGGYIYLIDRNCKIRWAAAGEAEESDKACLWKFVKALIKEESKTLD